MKCERCYKNEATVCLDCVNLQLLMAEEPLKEKLNSIQDQLEEIKNILTEKGGINKTWK